MPHPPSPAADEHRDIFVGDGEMARLMRSHDWAATPLGVPDTWPNTLKVAIRLLLTSRFEMWVGWGPDIAFFYNDAYRPTLGDKHPRSLAMPTRELWQEIWDDVQPRLQAVYERGEATWDRALLLLLQRHGYLEETYHTFSYSPLLGDTGQVEGVFCAVTEETERVLGERRLASLRELASGLTGARSREAVLSAAERKLALNRHDLPFTLIYLFAEDGHARLACATGIERGHACAPEQLALQGAAWDVAGLWQGELTELLHPCSDRDLPSGAWDRPPQAAALVPLIGQGPGKPMGVMVVGVNPYRPFDKDYLAFVKLLAGQLASSLASAEVYEAEVQRAAVLAEAVRLRQEAAEALSGINERLASQVDLRTRELADALERLQRESAERETAQAALRHAQRMESLGALTGGVAHDFNNLLQVIGGNLQLLSRYIAGNDRAEKRVQNALAGVARGAKLASQLLAFGRRQPLEPKVVNIGRFIQNMDDMLRRALGEEIEVETVISGGLWNTLIDPGQIENALLNLAINARDAMDGRGQLTIEAGNALLDDEYARLHDDLQAGQYVMVAVTDTGTGIAPEIMERVFEPFFSTKPEGKGTGLGLSMVYGFVKQSGGHVKVYSEVGEGTTIKLYLPRVLESEDVLADPASQPAIGGTETVLVVEDDEDVRETAVAILAELGYRVLRARDALSALSVIDSGVPIDVLFTDVVMPGPLRSPELARKARERLPQVAVLFTSGYTENAIVHGGRLDAGVELLSKPYTREALARKIRHVLANQAQRRVAANAAAPAPEAAGLRILVVEDDALIRSSTAEMLSEQGHLVMEACDAGSALRTLAAAPVDVLLTDFGLPDLTGAELVHQALQRWPGLRIVFATGDHAAPAELGMASAVILSKPYEPEDLSAALAKVRRA
jgi:signal transduction histidine kinase/DNA-binding response OmpR family regulator